MALDVNAISTFNGPSPALDYWETQTPQQLRDGKRSGTRLAVGCFALSVLFGSAIADVVRNIGSPLSGEAPSSFLNSSPLAQSLLAVAGVGLTVLSAAGAVYGAAHARKAGQMLRKHENAAAPGAEPV